MSIRYVLPSAFALAIALGLSFGPVQAAEGDMARGAASPKMDTPSAAPDVSTPGATPNAREERPGPVQCTTPRCRRQIGRGL